MFGRKVALFIFFIFVLVCPFKVFAFQNEPDGFRGIKWGTNISTLNGMGYVETDPRYGGVKIYIREGDELKIGSAQLEKIFYGFWNGEFCDVAIFTKDDISWLGLKDACFEKFGIGAKPGRFIDCYLWEGNKTRIFLDRQNSGLRMSSMEVLKKQEVYEKQKAREGAQKGF